MKQKVLEFNGARVLMWDNQDLLIERENESISLNIGELLYIIQEWQTAFGPMRFPITGEWKGVELTNG